MKASLLLCLILLLQFADEVVGGTTPTGRVQYVAPTTTAATPTGVSITSSTDMVQPGLTPDLSVTCTYPAPTALGLASLVSLVVSHRENNLKYQEIASVNYLEPMQVKELAHVGAHLTGQLQKSKTSFIKLEWTYPTENNTGEYRCEATTLNGQGHAVSAYASIRILRKSQNLQSLIEEFQKFSRHQHDINNDLRAQIQKQNPRLSGDQHSELFHISKVTDGKQYLVSRGGGASVEFAEALCNSAGGHLADIKNQTELDEVKAFLQALPTGDSRIAWTYFSPTDAEDDGRWVYRHSKELMTFNDIWATGQPYKNSIFNCAVLHHTDWKAGNTVCSGSKRFNFICERNAAP